MSHDESRTLKRWMLLIAAGQLVLSAGVAVVSGGRAGRVEAQTETRTIAQDVVREEWIARLEAETKRIASEAAAAAADRAVRETVTPIAIDVARSDARDVERYESLRGRVSRIEERLERARPVPPARSTP